MSIDRYLMGLVVVASGCLTSACAGLPYSYSGAYSHSYPKSYSTYVPYAPDAAYIYPSYQRRSYRQSTHFASPDPRVHLPSFGISRSRDYYSYQGSHREWRK